MPDPPSVPAVQVKVGVGSLSRFALAGAVKATVAGNYVYVLSEQSGLNVIDVSSPRTPRLVATVGSPDITGGRSLAIQFRYCFVVDSEGFKVVDITQPASPQLVPGADVRLADARGVFVMRAYAYVAAGHEGVVIIDIETPDEPFLDQTFNADGQMDDTNAITTGSINASTFAFVADGRNGLRVLRLLGPEVPGSLGFSARPVPELLATYRTRGPALAIAQGIPRDRPVDEDGNQIGVGGRLGSHPMTKSDMDKLLRRDGKIYTVKD